MRKIFICVLAAAATLAAVSCEQAQQSVNLEITSYSLAESAEFGTSADFSVTAPAASNVTVTISRGGELLISSTVREASDNVFSGTLAIPYTKNLADGEYDVLIMATGTGSQRAEESAQITLSHPEFSSVRFLAEDRTEYSLVNTEGNVWSYTGTLPAALSGVFSATSSSGSFSFGGSSLDNVEAGSTEALEIYEYKSELTDATISFDVVSFEIGFPIYLMTIDVPATSDVSNPGTVDVELRKGQLVEFTNLGGLWVDVDFFDKNDDGTYTFRAEGGRYRLTNQSDWGLLRTERLNASGGMGTFGWDASGNITVNEAIWVIGNYNIGKPGLHSVREGRQWSDWETYDALCMAKIDAYEYQITLLVTNYADYKFFGTKLDWGDIYGANYDLANSNLNNLTKIGTITGADGNFRQSLAADPTTDQEIIMYPQEGMMIRFTFDVTNPKGIIVTAEQFQ